MKIQQNTWTNDTGWKNTNGGHAEKSLVLAFGNRYILEDPTRYEEIRSMYPNSDIIINSTSGEIQGQQVLDNSIVLTSIQFEKSTYKIVTTEIGETNDSYKAGEQLVDKLPQEGLRHVFIISDGGSVNGSELARSFNEKLDQKITTTGGLAGDDARFEKTLVGCNSQPIAGKIVAVGLYGDTLSIGYGSVGGWDTFGPKRTITKSDNNVLFELDGKSALDLYKQYLGDKADGLPGSALLFPLSVQIEGAAKSLVRTILSVDEETQSMTFAGNVPEGATAQLMKANFDKLIDGAFQAAEDSIGKSKKPQLALLVSCVGRKLVLDQRVEEEVESVLEVVGEGVPVTGFYSYGELSPFAGFHNCELHNQTMTITLLGED